MAIYMKAKVAVKYVFYEGFETTKICMQQVAENNEVSM